jgi:hypothetical protein
MYRKIELPLLKIEAKPLTVGDFIESGLNFQLFQTVRVATGIFGKLEEEEQKKDQKIKPEMMEFIDLVLSLSVRDYDQLADKIKIITEKIGVSSDLYRIAIFNQIIGISTDRYKTSKKPNRDLIESIHFVSKAYGIEPWEMVNMGLDRYLFNEFVYSVGTQAEIRIAKRASKQSRR